MRLFFKALLCLAVAVLALPYAAAGADARATVVIYPLIASANAPAELGLAVSNILSTGMAQGGDITIADPGAPVAQSDYLTTARKLGAEYYVSGYVSTIGSQVAAVEQLVSTKSGVMVWRTSSTYAVPADAKATGAIMHDIVMQFSSQGFATFGSGSGPAPAATSAAAPPAGAKPAPAASPLRIPSYDAAPAPAPTRTPVPVTTGYSIVVGPFTSNQEGLNAINYAANSAVQLLPRFNMSGSRLDGEPADGGTSYGLLICAQQGSDYYLTGALNVSRDDPSHGFTFTVLLHLKAYDCNARTARPLEFDASTDSVSVPTAIDNALSEALPELGATKHSVQR